MPALIRYLNGHGRNALHTAAEFGRSVQVVCKLLKLGVDCTAQNDAEQTPADVAREKGHTLLAQLLDRAAQDKQQQQQQQQQQA